MEAFLPALSNRVSVFPQPWVTEISVHRCCCRINATSTLEALVDWPMIHHSFSNSSSRRTRTHPPQTGTKPGIKISVWQPPSFTSHWACNLKNLPWTHHLHCCLTAWRWWQTFTMNTSLPFMSDCLALATSSQGRNLKNIPWTHHSRCCPTAWRWRQTLTLNTPLPLLFDYLVLGTSSQACNLKNLPWTHHLRCCPNAWRWQQTLTLNPPLPLLFDDLVLATSSQACNLQNLPWTHHLHCCLTAWRWRHLPWTHHLHCCLTAWRWRQVHKHATCKTYPEHTTSIAVWLLGVGDKHLPWTHHLHCCLTAWRWRQTPTLNTPPPLLSDCLALATNTYPEHTTSIAVWLLGVGDKHLPWTHHLHCCLTAWRWRQTPTLNTPPPLLSDCLALATNTYPEHTTSIAVWLLGVGDKHLPWTHHLHCCLTAWRWRQTPTLNTPPPLLSDCLALATNTYPEHTTSIAVWLLGVGDKHLPWTHHLHCCLTAWRWRQTLTLNTPPPLLSDCLALATNTYPEHTTSIAVWLLGVGDKHLPWTHHLHCCLTAWRWRQTLTLNTPPPLLSDCLALATNTRSSLQCLMGRTQQHV